jgi:ATP-dependent DNA helicase RecG
VATDLGWLWSLLRREGQAGATNLISGGMDAAMRAAIRGESRNSVVRRIYRNLPASGYAALGLDDRKLWLQRALATIEIEQSSENTRTTPLSRSGKKKETTSSGPKKTSVARVRKNQIAPGELGLDAPLSDAASGLSLNDLKKLGVTKGINTIRDALFYFPRTHNDYSSIVRKATDLIPDEMQTFRGIVRRTYVRKTKRGLFFAEAVLNDLEGRPVKAIWFNLFRTQGQIAQRLPVGSDIALAGKARLKSKSFEFQAPEIERLDSDTDQGKVAGRHAPVYSLTEGISQQKLRSAVSRILDKFANRIEDPLPEEIRERRQLIPLRQAVVDWHYPASDETRDAAQRRISFDQLLINQLQAIGRRQNWIQGQALELSEESATKTFIDSLPFPLTTAQIRSLAEIRADLTKSAPMARLLEGDVGSGKTVVALSAMLSAIESGEQHYRTILKLLADKETGSELLQGMVDTPGFDRPLRVVLLTGSTKGKDRTAAIELLKHGGADIAVGTHALIQDGVDYFRLGLAVIDEQHRFGVMQRAALRKKGQVVEAGGTTTPHLLVMSATPIPRTLRLASRGDLAFSRLDELPAGRSPVATKFVQGLGRLEAYAQIRKEVSEGRQAFIICSLVEGSDNVQARAATDEFERLRTEVFADISDSIALVHGRMSSTEKEAKMRSFSDGKSSILVATSVVEVGIDVPNATVMLIEDADRFGLSQLHQFRGRVGRGLDAAYCYLAADAPTADAEQRLNTLEANTDGFKIAEADLEFRGPGELFGVEQSGEGVTNLFAAALLDIELISAAKEEAEILLEKDPGLKDTPHRLLRYQVPTIQDGNLVIGEVH